MRRLSNGRIKKLQKQYQELSREKQCFVFPELVSFFENYHISAKTNGRIENQKKAELFVEVAKHVLREVES